MSEFETENSTSSANQRHPLHDEHYAKVPTAFSKLTEYSNLDGLVTGIIKLFGAREKEAEHPHIKVQNLKETATLIMQQLQAIRNDLEGGEDEELFLHVRDLVRSMEQGITAVHAIFNQIMQTREVTHQVKAYELYTQWISKARPWSDLLNDKNVERERLIKTIAAFVTSEQIDRDIRYIQNYPSQSLAEKFQSELEHEPELLRIFRELNALKRQPSELGLEELRAWKAEVIKRRGEFYHAALQVIDGIIPHNDE